MSEELTLSSSQGEADALARRMAHNYRDGVEYYRDLLRTHANLTPQQRLSQTQERADEIRTPTDSRLEKIFQTPLTEIDWWDMETVENADAGQAHTLWLQIKEAAREELQSGQRAVEAVTCSNDSPFERARFLVLREELAQEWQPKNGIEQALIDQMAQAQTMYQHWLNISHIQARYQYKGLSRQEERYEAPRVSEQDCQEFSANMTDRFQRAFLRTLRALRDMRRYAPVIVQNNGGQVNVGAQQMNVAA